MTANDDGVAAERRRVDDPRPLRVERLMEQETTLRGSTPDSVEPILSWLAAAQNPSGSWGSTFEFTDTATVVDALSRVEPAGLSCQQGVAWLTGHPALDNDELSRQILALDHVEGLDLEDLVHELLGSRNAAVSSPATPNYPEGGWGLEPGYETDALTTALALLALDAAGVAGGIGEVSEPLAGGTTNVHTWQVASDAVQVRIAISVTGSTIRLRMAQGAPPSPAGPYFSLPPGGPYNILFPDSGLPFTPGTNYIAIESPNPPSQPATYTFAASYQTPDFDTRSLAEALAYLREAQNPDGGFGLQAGQPTSLYTTLHVVPALLAWDGYDSDAELASAVGYIEGQQLPDGSFGTGGMPVSYLTALAALNLLRLDGCPIDVDTLDAIDALLALQDPDGSWEHEPYDTGLALDALAGYDNDGDGVLRDGDCSGVEGDDLCAPGAPVGCDDNCRAYYNPDQQPVVFGQTLLAPNKVSFSWPDPADVVFVRGPLSQLGSYTVNRAGMAAGATSISTAVDHPAAGTGFWYLVRLAGDCTVTSWQSSPGAEPGRDLASIGNVAVDITSPTSGAVLAVSPATVSGTVDGVDPVNVTVNGVGASVVGSTFSASVPLTRGLNTVTAIATDAAGFDGMDQVTVRLVDHSIPRGGLATGFRIFTASSQTLDQVAFFTEQQAGLPPGVTYTTTSVSRISATEMRVGYRINVAAGAATGIFGFTVTYGLLDAGMQPLGPLTGNVFAFEIQVTP